MPIEFRCPKCSRLLRTKDDTAGKQAKCPECGTVVQIPATPGAAPAADDLLAGLAPSDLGRPPVPPAENPYQAPTATSPVMHRVAPSGDIRPTRVALGDIYSRSWAIYKNALGMCLGVMVTFYVITYAFQFLMQMIMVAVTTQAPSQEMVITATVFTGLVNWLFGIWLGAGQANFFLKTARGDDAKFADLFSGGRWFVPIAVASLLYGLIFMVGLILLIVPGIILALMLSQYYLLIIDRDAGIIDSLQQSREIMRGNKLTLFVMGLSWMGLGILGLLACGIGLLFVMPFIALMYPVFYLGVTGQPTAADRFGVEAAPV